MKLVIDGVIIAVNPLGDDRYSFSGVSETRELPVHLKRKHVLRACQHFNIQYTVLRAVPSARHALYWTNYNPRYERKNSHGKRGNSE